MSTGNITVSTGTYIGNGAGLNNLTGANVSGTVANANYAAYAGNVSTANSATTAGTVTTNAQPNITSVGTLSSLTVNANITTSNGVFVGNGSGLTNLSVANANFASYAATVTGAAQSNITSLGTLTGLGVNGTVTAVAFTANTGVFTGNGSGLNNVTASKINTVSTSNNATYYITMDNGAGTLLVDNTGGGNGNSTLLSYNPARGYLTTQYFRAAPTTANLLLSANIAGAGARTIISDANTVTFNNVVGGGGSNIIPVFCDGTDWRVG